MNKEAAEKLLELIGEVTRTAKDCGFAERGYDILSQKEKEEAFDKAAHDVAFAIAAETEGASSAVNEPQLKEALESLKNRRYWNVLLVCDCFGTWEIYRSEGLEYWEYYQLLAAGHDTIAGAITAAKIWVQEYGG